MTRPNWPAATSFIPLLVGLACSSGGAGHPEAGTGGTGGRSATPDADADSATDAVTATDAVNTADRAVVSDATADRTSPGAPEASGDGPASPDEGPGVFVAVGVGGRRIRSTDYGVSWADDVQLEANGGDDQDALRTVIWGDQQFVALGYHTLTSPDGKTWTDHGANAIDQWIGSAVYAQGRYVALGGYGLRATSPDAVAWQDHSIDTTASHAGDGLIYEPDHDRLVGVNDDGQRSTSTDGTSWVYSAGATGTFTSELAYGNGVLVGLDGTAVVLSTDGGSTWTAGATLGSNCLGLLFAQGHFTALADGHVFTSSDGQTWTDHIAPDATNAEIAYGHGTYIMLNGFSLSRSTDGITWNQPVVVPGTTNYLTWVAFGPTG